MIKYKIKKSLSILFMLTSIIFILILSGCGDGLVGLLDDESLEYTEDYPNSFRREIIVTENASSGDLNDYQVQIKLNSSNFNFDHVDQSGTNIRFTYYDTSIQSETSISYWLEHWSYSDETALIWIKIPNIPSGDIATVYFYYGKQTTNSGSNGLDTFFWFDDFSSDRLSEYNQLRPPSNGWGVSNGEFYINMDPNESFYEDVFDNAPLLSIDPPAGNYLAQVTLIGQPNTSSQSGDLMIYQDDDNFTGITHRYSGWKYWEVYEEDTAVNTTIDTGPCSNEVIYYRFVKLSGTYYAGGSSDRLDWTYIEGPTIAYSNPVIGLSAYSHSASVMTFKFDNFFVCKFISPMPTLSIGEEEIL